MHAPLWLRAIAPTAFGLALGANAHAFPGFYAAKKDSAPKAHSTHVVVMKKGEATAVSVMPDYEGPLEPFAMVLLVPDDVTVERVTTIKREFVDRVDQISAPRFHEFWEQDPCDPGPVEQEWERNLKVEGSGFLGEAPPVGSDKKVAKELFLDVTAKQKEGEYKTAVVPVSDVMGWLKGKGYVPPKGAEQALGAYGGMKAIVSEVDPNRIELVGGERAQLSPIRFWTEKPFDTLPSRLGLVNAPEKQELVVYVIHPEQRFEVKNYKWVYPPTNINVDFVVKERMGEFYNALYDIILSKTPNVFLQEYAWSTEGCGQPCATEPLMISELLSLGGDVFEQWVPEEEKHPKPPELSKEEKDAFKESLKGLKPKERKEREETFKKERETVVERKALVERHKYVLSRFHYRYDASSLATDPKFGPAGSHVEGGIWVPKGPKMEIAVDVKSAAQSRHQTRYLHFHPWKPVIQCQNPDRHRWGKAPRDYRGLRKIWIADDLTRKSRTQIKPAAVVKTPIPELGLAAASAEATDAGADGGTTSEASAQGKCGCRIPGERRPSPAGLLALLPVGIAFLRRKAKNARKSG